MEENEDPIVPVAVRTHELNQLKEMLPNAVSSLEAGGKGDEAEELQRIYTENIEGVEPEHEIEYIATYLPLKHDEWRYVVRGLNRARYDCGRLRTQWLQSKIIDRVTERLERVGEVY
jgi:hypothetical protein